MKGKERNNTYKELVDIQRKGRQESRERKRAEFEAVMCKNNFETIGDICDFVGGLSNKFLASWARSEVLRHHLLGLTPSEVYKLMEGKK